MGLLEIISHLHALPSIGMRPQKIAQCIGLYQIQIRLTIKWIDSGANGHKSTIAGLDHRFAVICEGIPKNPRPSDLSLSRKQMATQKYGKKQG